MTSVSRRRKLLNRILDKRCKNVAFEELCTLVEAYGCTLDRISGSYYIYTYPGLERPIVIQKPHHRSDVPAPFCRQVIKAIQDMIDLEEEADENAS